MSTLAEIQTDISIMYDGSPTAPASSSEDYQIRTNRINKFIEKLYISRDWEHLATTSEVTLTNNVATISMRDYGVLDVRDANYKYDEVSYEDFENYETGDYKFRYNSPRSIKSTESGPLTVRYIPSFTALSGESDTVNFPSSLIAKGVCLDLKLIEDPEEVAPIQQFQASYQDELNKFIGLQNRSHARFFKSIGW